MALSDILAKIKEEIQNQAKEFEKAHEAELAELKKQFADKEKDQASAMDKKVENHCSRIIEKTEILAEMEGKNALLHAKREMIDEIFEAATEELVKSSKYEEILVDLLKKADFKEDSVEIVPAKGKEAETKKAISASGKHFKMSEKSAHIKGGFIIRSKEIEIDNSFKTIIQTQLRDDLEIEVAKLLFA